MRQSWPGAPPVLAWLLWSNVWYFMNACTILWTVVLYTFWYSTVVRIFCIESTPSQLPTCCKLCYLASFAVGSCENLWFWLGERHIDEHAQSSLVAHHDAGAADACGLGRVHGARGGRRVARPGVVVRQALRRLESGHHPVHAAVRLPALLRPVRQRLRLGAWRGLPNMPGKPVRRCRAVWICVFVAYDEHYSSVEILHVDPFIRDLLLIWISTWTWHQIISQYLCSRLK